MHKRVILVRAAEARGSVFDRAPASKGCVVFIRLPQGLCPFAVNAWAFEGMLGA